MYSTKQFTTKILAEGSEKHAAVTLDTARELLDCAERVRRATSALRSEYREMWKTFIRFFEEGRKAGLSYRKRSQAASMRLNGSFTKEQQEAFHKFKSDRKLCKDIVVFQRRRLARLLKLETWQDAEALVAFIADVRHKRDVSESELRDIGALNPSDIIDVLAFRFLISQRSAASSQSIN